MDEIHSFTTSPRPRIDIHVYFLQVCRPFSRNAVYLQRNVISRVIAIETPQVWLQFLRVSPYIPSREKNLDVDINASFIPHTYLFFPLFGLTYNKRSSKSETAIRNNLRDYLSRRNGGAEGNRAQAGDCVRETCTDWLVSCQSLERRMCVSRGTNSRVSADDRCVSVARLEKAVPRTTRKLFTAHLSRPRSRCTSHVYVYRRIAKILATTSKYSVARTPYLRHGDFSSRTESQLERDICHKSRNREKFARVRFLCGKSGHDTST